MKKKARAESKVLRANLSVSNDSDGGAVLLDLVQIVLDRLLAIVVTPFLGVFDERLLLGFVPKIVILFKPSCQINMTAEGHH